VALPLGEAPGLGREIELAGLEACLDGVLAGRGAVALLAGEPGIGKTRLAGEIARLAAAEGLRVFWGSGYAGEGAPAFWPWIEVIRQALPAGALA